MLPSDGQGPLLPGAAEVSEATQRMIDEEVRRLVAAAHEEVVALLEENRARLDSLAQALLEHETLDQPDAYAAAGLATARPRYDRGPPPAGYALTVEPLLDTLGRPLETLRVSITDRCNFRCVYCMPKEVFGRDHAFLERQGAAELRGDRARRRASSRGSACGRVRITGGEPLVRRNVEHLVELLAAVPGARARADDERRAARAEGGGARDAPASTG